MSAPKFYNALIRTIFAKSRPKRPNPLSVVSPGSSSSDILVIRRGMNVPNTLTILRIFFVPFLVASLVEQELRLEWHGVVWVPNELVALAIFLTAAATDLRSEERRVGKECRSR